MLLVLAVGGCVAFLGAAATEVGKSIETGASEAGGTGNPLTITPGKAFDVRGFSYKAGWKVRNDAVGSMEVVGLRVTNNREDRDGALVEIKIWKGTEVVALANCTTEQIQPGTTTKVSCISGDKLPKKYSKVTINDSF